MPITGALQIYLAYLCCASDRIVVFAVNLLRLGLCLRTWEICKWTMIEVFTHDITKSAAIKATYTNRQIYRCPSHAPLPEPWGYQRYTEVITRHQGMQDFLHWADRPCTPDTPCDSARTTNQCKMSERYVGMAEREYSGCIGGRRGK